MPVPMPPPATEADISGLSRRAGLAWLHRHGKDGPSRLLHVYRRDNGRYVWRPSPVPARWWTQPDIRPADVLFSFARGLRDPKLQAVMAATGNWAQLAGLLFVGGAWGVYLQPAPGEPDSAFRARADQAQAEAYHRGASTMTGRREIVVTYYAGRDGSIGIGRLDPFDDPTQDEFHYATDARAMEMTGNIPSGLREILAAWASAAALADALTRDEYGEIADEDFRRLATLTDADLAYITEAMEAWKDDHDQAENILGSISEYDDAHYDAIPDPD